ncbi:MAG: restriction endonuclease [Phycisphaerae bacterium]|nr:restriction endonuclease [Phycisphaerae bacterium]
MGEIGDVTCWHTARGLARYSVLVTHAGLHKFQEIKSDDRYVLLQKAHAKLAQWDEMWERQQEAADRETERRNQAAEIEAKIAYATDHTKQIQLEHNRLETLLLHTLSVNDCIDWNSLKSAGDYPHPKPQRPVLPPIPIKPVFPPQPRSTDPAYIPPLGLLDRLFASRRKTKIDAQAKRFASDCEAWKARKAEATELYNTQVRDYNATLLRLQEKFTNDTSAWESAREVFLQEQLKSNAAIDSKKALYESGAPEAIIDYCELVLARSEYPDYFPQTYELEYRPESTLLVVNYQLPAPRDIPTLKEISYVRSRDEYSEKHVSEAQRNALYDSVLYQVAIRTIHELFEADQVNAFESIVFNGIVQSTDSATGHETTNCILSVQADKSEFMEMDLSRVDPKACFRRLKGVGSSKLHSITAVAPLVTMEKEDRRFVEAFDVAHALDNSTNLAAMDWEEFEHLIRQLFESHFAAGGGEVRVTRASRDGGVDAVVFDPDPIRGGKIVIQAKRYTVTVGVDAVRDLYGTVINEGANKGILVTTSHYGPDAYGFAKGKPITLLDGGNLLHLLQSHGYKAKIDIKEARSQMAG